MEKVSVTENMRVIFDALQKATEPMTAEDIAAVSGLGIKSVNASFNRIVKLGYGIREVATQDLGECRTRDVKILKLTPEGEALDLHNGIVIKVK